MREKEKHRQVKTESRQQKYIKRYMFVDGACVRPVVAVEAWVVEAAPGSILKHGGARDVDKHEFTLHCLLCGMMKAKVEGQQQCVRHVCRLRVPVSSGHSQHALTKCCKSVRFELEDDHHLNNSLVPVPSKSSPFHHDCTGSAGAASLSSKRERRG